MDELLKENDEEAAPKVISMKEYLSGFCKEHNIDMDKNNMRKLPMHIYLNSA